MKSPNASRRRGQRGIGLIEALVSLLVLALGMMSFAALQGRLRLNSDVAKQRSEATRLGQEAIEGFRSFGTLATFDAVGSGTTTVSASTVASNTRYTVTRTVTDLPRAGLTNAPVKNLLVTVTWADRTALTAGGVVLDNQSVTFRTLIARSDPAVAASLALSPNGSPVRDLLGRDIQVPIPAKNLGHGISAAKASTSSGIAYVFNNDTGMVTARCAGITAQTNGLALTSDPNDINNLLQPLQLNGVDCTRISAYLVSGFIRRSVASNPTESNSNEPALPGGVTVRVDLDNTPPPTGSQGTLAQLTAAHWPVVSDGIGVTIGSGSTTYTPAECNAEALKTVRYTTPVNYTQTNNGNTSTVTSTIVIAIIPENVAIAAADIAPWIGIAPGSAATQIVAPEWTGERFMGYSCLVRPIDLDLNNATPVAYTARVTLWPTSGWAIGTASGLYKICRFSADYNLNGGVRVVSGSNVTSIDNQEHTYAYLNAQRSLSNQNFLMIAGNRSCPTDGAVEVNGQGGENYTDETTVTHQP